jgi:hypothetical protein
MIALYKAVSIRLLPFFVVMALILALWQPGYAAGVVTLEASTHQGQKGGQVKVTVTADNAAGTEGGQFILKFDPAVVKPVTIEPGSLVTNAESNLHMANLEYARGELIFMWVTAAADTGNKGPLCNIVFDLIEDGVTNITFNEVVIAPDGVEKGQPVPGRITVGDPGADRNGSENSNTEPDDEQEDTPGEEPDEEVAEPETGEEAEETDEQALPGEVSYGVSSYWLPALIIAAIMAAALVFIIRRGKKNKAKH